MEKIKHFCLTYSKETGLVSAMVVMTICMLLGAKYTGENHSVYLVAEMIMLPLVFCSVVFICGQRTQNSREAETLRLTSALCLLGVIAVLIGYSYYLQQAVPSDDMLKIGISSCWSVVFAGCYFEQRIYKLKKYEKLQKENPAEYLRMLIKQQRELTEQQQLSLFDQPNADDLLFKYMLYEDLTKAAEQKLLDASFVLNLMEAMPQYVFCDNSCATMFTKPDAPKLVMVYVTNGHALSDENELKMFDLPNAAEVVTEYMRHQDLSDEGEMRLFELTDAEKLVKRYNRKYVMCSEATELAKKKGWI